MRKEGRRVNSVPSRIRKNPMNTAKLRTLYFVLCVLFAVAAACLSPALAGSNSSGDSLALDSSPSPMDARIALAR